MCVGCVYDLYEIRGGFMGQIQFDIDNTCVKCGACAIDCPVGCISEEATQFIIGKGCIRCGDCYSICPVGAVKIVVNDSDIKD